MIGGDAAYGTLRPLPLQERKRWCTLHRLLPMYAVFTGSSERLACSGALLETVTLVHIQLAALASLLDVTEQSAPPE
jgi:hypothetical protein